MPPRRKKKPKISQKQRGEQLIASLDEIRAIPLEEGVESVAAPTHGGGFGTSEGHSVNFYMHETLAGTIQDFWISFPTGRGAPAALRFPPNVAERAPIQIGEGLVFGLTTGFTMPWDELNEDSVPDAVKRAPPPDAAAAAPAPKPEGGTAGEAKEDFSKDNKKRKRDKAEDGDDEKGEDGKGEGEKGDDETDEGKKGDDAGEEKEEEAEQEGEDEEAVEFYPIDSGFGKELQKPTAKWCAVTLLDNKKDIRLQPWSAKTNDSHAIAPENDDVVLVHNAVEHKARLGKAVLRQVKLGLSRQQAGIHPDPKYHASRPKWAR